MFAVLRALVMAGTVAIAFGANPPHGAWLVVGAVIAMQPSLGQSVLISAQRVAGAGIGALAAILVLLIPANVTGSHLVAITLGLEVVALVCLADGVAVRFWNCALYTAAIAAGVLILLDLGQPSNDSAEGYRVLWTLCGVAIGVLVMLIAGLLGKRKAKTQSQAGPGTDVPAQRTTTTDQPRPAPSN